MTKPNPASRAYFDPDNDEIAIHGHLIREGRAWKFRFGMPFWLIRAIVESSRTNQFVAHHMQVNEGDYLFLAIQEGPEMAPKMDNGAARFVMQNGLIVGVDMGAETGDRTAYQEVDGKYHETPLESLPKVYMKHDDGGTYHWNPGTMKWEPAINAEPEPEATPMDPCMDIRRVLHNLMVSRLAWIPAPVTSAPMSSTAKVIQCQDCQRYHSDPEKIEHVRGCLVGDAAKMVYGHGF